MAVFSNNIVATKFIDPPNNMMIELLYREGDAVIPYVLEVDFTSDDFNSLLEEVTLEEIEKNTSEGLKAEKQAFDSIIQQEIDRRWEEEQTKVKAAYDDAENYAQKVIEREYDKLSAEWQKIYEQWENIDKEYKKVDAYAKEEYKKVDIYAGKEYEKVDTYAEIEKTKKFQEVQEEFQKVREDLQSRFNITPSSDQLDGRRLFIAIDQNNEDNDFVFNLKVAILEDPLIAKSKDKRLKLAIRKCKSVLELLKIYAEAKEAA